jgi:MoxR-like ATPase
MIPPPDRKNVIVWGRPGHGKSRLAENLSKEHGRLLLTPDEIVNWHFTNETMLAGKLQNFLAEK